MRRFTALLVLLAACPLANAVEPFVVYDRFGDPNLDPARWSDTERIRIVKGGSLQLLQRTWGTTDADAGVTAVNWNENIAHAERVTAIKARITVTGLETQPCASNPTASDARARLIGSFFNVGTPTPGSQVGDVIAQVRLFRASNSADPAGVLRVQGFASLCSSADCSAATTIGNLVDLGTVAIGTAATVQLQWDQPGKTFYFSRDKGGSGSVAYAESDVSPPGLFLRQLSTRVNIANCKTAGRISALVDAKFDNVSVNASAAP